MKKATVHVNEIRGVTVARAVSMLKAAGASYRVEFNGSEYRSDNRKRNDFVGKHDYVKRLNDLKIGDVATFQCDTPTEVARLQSALAAHGATSRGPGGLVTNRDSATLTVSAMAVLPLVHPQQQVPDVPTDD